MHTYLAAGWSGLPGHRRRTHSSVTLPGSKGKVGSCCSAPRSPILAVTHNGFGVTMYMKVRVEVRACVLLSLSRFLTKLLASGAISPLTLRHSLGLKFRLLEARLEAMTEDRRMVLGTGA